MAKRKPNFSELPPGTKIEVRLTKQMTFANYKKSIEIYKEKGWRVEAFQIGFTD